MRILYLEDNSEDANLVSRYVQTTPHDLVVVNSAGDAWALAGQEHFDLILVDVMIGRERVGFDFAQALRQHQFQQPIVAVTALSTPQDVAQCQQVGFDYVLVKPYAVHDLAGLIDQVAG
jgi:CheY-like chemotaxis protein